MGTFKSVFPPPLKGRICIDDMVLKAQVILINKCKFDCFMILLSK